jgi:hypothetical protein
MFNNPKIAGQFSTPENLVSLITEISHGISAKAILDPACGTAILLTSVAQGKGNVVVALQQNLWVPVRADGRVDRLRSFPDGG